MDSLLTVDNFCRLTVSKLFTLCTNVKALYWFQVVVYPVQATCCSYRSMASSSKNVPSDAMMELLSPDGYYTYLQIPKPALAQVQQSGEPPEFDDEAVKKSYRKLSRKHHPDKPGGDADTFRLLNRAHKVLSTQKLREQYNILGIDLDDDEDKHEEEAEGESSTGSSGTAQGIVHEIANMILTGIVQLGVRTRKFLAMMG